MPTPPQPLGRNGWKFDASTAGNVTATTPTTTVISRPVSTNCTQPATRTPNQFATNGGTKIAKRDDRHRGAVDAEHGDDVLAAEHREHGCADADAEEEPVPRHARGRVAERAAHVARHAARVGVARGERGERARERDGEHEHRGDGEDRGRAGGGGREARAARGCRCRARSRCRARCPGRGRGSRGAAVGAVVRRRRRVPAAMPVWFEVTRSFWGIPPTCARWQDRQLLIKILPLVLRSAPRPVRLADSRSMKLVSPPIELRSGAGHDHERVLVDADLDERLQRAQLQGERMRHHRVATRRRAAPRRAPRPRRR